MALSSPAEYASTAVPSEEVTLALIFATELQLHSVENVLITALIEVNAYEAQVNHPLQSPRHALSGLPGKKDPALCGWRFKPVAISHYIYCQ